MRLAKLYDDGLSIKTIQQQTGRGQVQVSRAIRTYSTMRPSKVGRNATDKFKTLDSEAAYWLGFIAADGHIRYQPEKYRYELVVEVNKRDQAHVEKLRDWLGFGSVMERSRDDCVVFTFSSKQLVENLTLWLTPGNKTELDNFSKVPDEAKVDFVRGYFDGDGSVSRNRFSITSCPQTLIPVTNFIADIIGIEPKIYHKKENKALSANWTSKGRHLFGEKFAGAPSLERKWNEF